MKLLLCLALLATGLWASGCSLRVPLIPLFFLENTPPPEPISPLTNAAPAVVSAR
jgi:hypothetical protein